MTHRIIVLTLIPLLLVSASAVIPPASADQIAGVEPPKPDPNAAQNSVLGLLPTASAVFTATVVDVQTVARTANTPPTVAMNVTLKDPEMLKGNKPETLKFGYAATEGRGLFPKADQKVVVVVNPAPPGASRIFAMSDATAENLAAVKKAIQGGPAVYPAGWRLVGGNRLECPLNHPQMSASYASPADAPKCPECGQRYNNGKLCPACSVRLGRCATCGAQAVNVVTTQSVSQPADRLGWGEATNGLKAALEVESARGLPGQAIKVKLHVQNVSDQPIRALDWARPPGNRTVVTDAAGQSVVGGLARPPGDPLNFPESDFVTIFTLPRQGQSVFSWRTM